MTTPAAPKGTGSWPYQLGIRLVLDSVCYSNALPDWFDVPAINYSARESTIRQKIATYLQQPRPQPSFEVSLPRKAGDSKPWSVPSINDQIICQVCVSSLAAPLAKCVPRETVFSYRYRNEPSVLALTEDPLSSWRAFQRETRRRCGSGDCVLQIDLLEAFRSISRAKLIVFLRNLFPGRPEVDVLAALLESFAAGRPGIPLVNDSIFFLGNAYLSVVDQVVSRHTKNFIRFVDDYRVFGDQHSQLEALPRVLGPELAQLGFRMNPHKLMLSTGEEYLESLSRIKYAETESDGAKGDPPPYAGSATVYSGLIPPDVMVAQIRTTLEHPQENLNEGRGRLLMASMRRARVDAQVVDQKGKNGEATLHDNFVDQLSQDRSVIARIIELLESYSGRTDEIWRLTWLLYLTKDIDPDKLSKTTAKKLQSTLADIRMSRSLPPLVRLWATERPQSRPTFTQIEAIHDRGYIDGGQLFLGGSKHG